jgi:hypothetical protein
VAYLQAPILARCGQDHIDQLRDLYPLMTKVIFRRMTSCSIFHQPCDELRKASLMVRISKGKVPLSLVQQTAPLVSSGKPIMGMYGSESFEALIISSEQEHGRILAARLGEYGVTPAYCSPLDAERIVLSRESVRLVFCDSCLIKQVYPSLLRVVHARQSRVLPVIFKSPSETEGDLQIQGLVDVDFIAPPFEGAVIEQIIRKVIASEAPPKKAIEKM